MCVCVFVFLAFGLFVRRLELLLSFSNKPIVKVPKPTSTVRKLCSIVDEIRENHKSSKMHKIYFHILSGRKENQVILVVIFWSFVLAVFFPIHILKHTRAHTHRRKSYLLLQFSSFLLTFIDSFSRNVCARAMLYCKRCTFNRLFYVVVRIFEGKRMRWELK